jgi:MFS transporter, DHA1 family, inner membrane transport protein
MKSLSIDSAALASATAPAELQAPLESVRRREQLVLAILASVQFTTVVSFMIVMPLAPQLMRTLGIDAAQFGLIVSSYTFAAGASGLVASSLVDRFPRRSTFLFLYAGFLLGTLLCAFAPSYPALVAARVATGAFGGILGGLSMTIVGDVFPEHRRGRATGMLTTGFALASVVGIPFGLFLGNHYGWHVPFLVLAVAGLPMLFLTPLALPRLDAHVQAGYVHPLRALRETFTHPGHLPAFALSAVLTIGAYAVFPFVSTYFVNNVGMSEGRLPLIYVFGGALTLIAAPIIGKLADVYGKLRIFYLIAPVSAVLLPAVTALPRVPTVIAVAVFGILMVANVGRMIAGMALITAGVEPRRRGGFMSANSSVQYVAAGLGASITGLIVRQTPGGPLERFALVGCFAALTTLLAIRLAPRVRAIDAPPVAAASIGPAAAEVTCDSAEIVLATLDQEDRRS